MLVTLNEVLKDAKKNNYAVGLFNTINLEMAKGVLQAAEETKSPVIISTAEVLLQYASLEELSYFLKPMAEKASIPVVLHFDHGITKENILKAIDLGFTSVMYDCSMLSYENNIKEVRSITKIAHSKNISVEAELGHVGSTENSAEGNCDNTIYTEPQQAKEFAEATKCDALAVSIGTVHGAYKETPKLDLQRLKQISDICDVPLVLHGGSGLSDDDFKNCIKNGIRKINIFTDINCAQLDEIYNKYKKGYGISDVTLDAINAIKTQTINKMTLFNCTQKY